MATQRLTRGLQRRVANLPVAVSLNLNFVRTLHAAIPALRFIEFHQRSMSSVDSHALQLALP